MMWVFIAVFLDVTMLMRMGFAMPNFLYIFSFATLVMFALFVSCIPDRITQTVIFTTTLIIQGAVYLSNIVAYRNLNEILTFETFRALKEIFSVHDQAVYKFWLDIFMIFSACALFITTSVMLILRYHRNGATPIRAGYELRGFTAVACTFFVTLTVPFAVYKFLPAVPKNATDRQTNARYLLKSFEYRNNYLRKFGGAFFYLRNFLEVIRLAPHGALPPIDVNWKWIDYTDDWQLSPDQNVIMFMMESIEGAAIHPDLTPNMYEIMEMSTVIDGYYSTERTCMTEYLALVGSQVHSIEMWSSYGNTDVPQALPRIFKRAGYDQVGAFHDYRKNFYGRENNFKPNRIGFDFMRDLTDYSVVQIGNNGDEKEENIQINRDINKNSDRVMFEEMSPDIAPADKSFFSYVLNVTPHAPHFASESIFPKTPHTFDADGWWELDTVLPDYTDADGQSTNSLKEVMKLINDHDLASSFNKITPDHDGINGADKDNRGQEIRRAVIAYLTSIYEYDRGVGILLERLKNTPDMKHDATGQTPLIDTTALVFYSDHFNYPLYNMPQHVGGGLLSNKWTDAVNGEKLAFFIYNPNDVKTANDPTRIIDRFTTSMDIYPTVAHLFGIPINTQITLGRSAFDPETVSVGVEYLKGRGFGSFFKTDNWTSFYKTYNTPPNASIPLGNLTIEEQNQIAVLRTRHDEVLETLTALRDLYKIGFDNTPAKEYNMKHE